MCTFTGQTFFVAIYAVPWVALMLPFFGVAVYFISLRNVSVFKEMNRIESVSKSPLLSYLQETHQGASTIRAFSRQQTYLLKNK